MSTMDTLNEYELKYSIGDCLYCKDSKALEYRVIGTFIKVEANGEISQSYRVESQRSASKGRISVATDFYIEENFCLKEELEGVMEEKRYTTLGMLEEIYKNPRLRFKTDGGEVGFYDNKLCWMKGNERIHPFGLTLHEDESSEKIDEYDGLCAYLNTMHFKWIKIEPKPKIVKFEDWEDSVWYYDESSKVKRYCYFKHENTIYKIDLFSFYEVKQSDISHNDLINTNWVRF